MDVTPAHINPFVMIARQDLVRILSRACPDVHLRMGTTVRRIEQDDDGVEVEFQDGSRTVVDLLVATDGRSSGTTWQQFRPRVVDTGWIYWTWWGPEKLVDATALVDYCGKGWFLGAYPVPGKCMFGVGLPVRRLPRQSSTEDVRTALAEALRPLVTGIPSLAEAVPAAERFYPWRVDDVTHSAWAKGRIALCGDAAASSIPTAGVGASHAIQSALVLAEELGDADEVPAALRRYEARCRRAVNSNLRQSRLVARTMLARGRIRSDTRDFVLRHYPAERVIKQLTDSVCRTF
jgi:FAD-dependent urate hydroxylase